MNPENNNLDNEQQFKVSDKLRDDLRNLHRVSVNIPPEIDRAILDKASKQLTRPAKRIRIFRWAGAVASAAAIIIFAYVFVEQKTYTNMDMSSEVNILEAFEDFDRNGTVNILDAFKLAKQIESKDIPDKKWDINGDGLVDKSDVDLVASAAVRLH